LPLIILNFNSFFYRDALGEDVNIKVSTEPEKVLSKSRKQIEESFQVFIIQ